MEGRQPEKRDCDNSLGCKMTSKDKKNLMKDLYLLGAGASMECGIPMANQMTKDFIQIAESHGRHHDSIHRILKFVVGGLKFRLGANGINPIGDANIEEVFNCIDSLANRDQLDISPFVSSWHHILNELDYSLSSDSPIDSDVSRRISNAVCGVISDNSPGDNSYYTGTRTDYASKSDVRKIVKEMIKEIGQDTYDSRHSSDIVRSIRKAMQPSSSDAFHKVKEWMINQLFKMVYIPPEKAELTEYLTPLLRHCSQTNSVIATLNYDNSIETAANRAGIPYCSGMSDWSKSSNVCFNPSSVKLIKLHGSINWEKKPTTWYGESLLGIDRISELIFDDQGIKKMARRGYQPAVIFGQRNKLTAHGPFLELLYCLREEAKKCERLIVIGYSFADPHINEYLARWTLENGDRKVIVVNGRSYRPSDSPFAGSLEAKGRMNQLKLNASEGIVALTAAAP